MGVHAVGIVDFDALNDRTELGKSLNNLGFEEPNVARVLTLQQSIADAVKELQAGIG